MRQVILMLTVVMFVLSSCSQPEVGSHDTVLNEQQSLMPFETYFTPDRYKAVRVSPDGQKIAYLAPYGGADNYFVASVTSPTEGRPLTQVTDGNIRAGDVAGNVMYRWSNDSKYLIYPKDYDGNEAYDLWAVDVTTGTTKNLTPNSGIKTKLVALSDENPHEIAISEYPLELPFPAIYQLNIVTGEKRTLIESEPGTVAYFIDHDFKTRLKLVLNSIGTFDIYTKDNADWRLIHHVKPEDRGNFMANADQKVFQTNAGNQFLYAYSSEGRNTGGLFEWNLQSGQRRLLAEDKKTDLSGVLYDPQTYRPIAYRSMWKRTVWHALSDDELQDDLDFLMQYQPSSDVFIENQSADNTVWVVRLEGPSDPTAFYLFNRAEKSLVKLFSASPQFEEMKLAPMYPYEMTSSDGLHYVSYYSLPVGSDADFDGIPDKPLPSVMLVHGGPEDERAQYAFGGILQWLANRGYATFYVNYRGSPGFGKKFLTASNGAWGGAMHRDLLEQVDWAVSKGIADKNRFGIMGGSYGGYASFVAATMTPDVFACAIPIVGPSTLEEFLPHWPVEEWSLRLGGDPRTEQGRAFLRSRSPLTYAEQTKNPVLVVHGAQDSRVPQWHADKAVKIMDMAGADVTYLLYPDEGHGIVKPHNTRSLWGVAEQFLAKCLGGRAEPLSDKLTGSSLQVVVGAEKIPQLYEALSAAAQ